jgi:hypothetical protein
MCLTGQRAGLASRYINDDDAPGLLGIGAMPPFRPEHAGAQDELRHPQAGMLAE